MANELELIYTGEKNIYAQLRDRDNPGSIAKVTGDGSGVFEPYVLGNIDQYDLPLTDHKGSWYAADMPSWIASGTNLAIIYRRYTTGVAPAEGDNVIAGPVQLTRTTIGASPSAPAGSTITLTEARAIVLDACLRVANDDTLWNNQSIDHAIQMVLGYANERAGLLTTTDTKATTGSQATVDLSTISGFHKALLVYARIGYDSLPEADFDTVRQKLDASTAEGQPQLLAFETNTTAYLSPVPDEAYTITLKWRSDIANFTAGTGSPSAVSFGVPARIIRPLLYFGAAPALQFNFDYQELSKTTAWREFKEYVGSLRGKYGSERGAAYRDAID